MVLPLLVLLSVMNELHKFEIPGGILAACSHEEDSMQITKCLRFV